MKIIKPGDWAALAVALVVVAFTAYGAYGRAAGEAVLLVESDQGRWLYPLDEDREIIIPGLLGDTIIHIHDHGVDVVESPCRDKICVNAGLLENPGDWTACLPNRVFIQVTGREEGEGLDDQSF